MRPRTLRRVSFHSRRPSSSPIAVAAFKKVLFVHSSPNFPLMRLPRSSAGKPALPPSLKNGWSKIAWTEPAGVTDRPCTRTPGDVHRSPTANIRNRTIRCPLSVTRCRSLISSEWRQTAWGRADRSVGSRYASASIRRRDLAKIATKADAAAGAASTHGSNERGWRR